MGLRLDNPRYRYHPDFGEILDFEKIDFVLDWCNAMDSKAPEDRARGDYENDEAFLRKTTIFCYQDIALPVYGIHRPYIARVLQSTAGKANATLIDVGAGGGQTGLAFHHLGYRVSFADIQSQSLLFLMYRLRSRRLNLPVYDLDAPVTIPMHDVAICFDVLEHVKEPERFNLIDRLTTYGALVFANLVREDIGQHGENLVADGVHYPLDFDTVTDYVSKRYAAVWEDHYPDKQGKPRQRLLIYSAVGARA